MRFSSLNNVLAPFRHSLQRWDFAFTDANPLDFACQARFVVNGDDGARKADDSRRDGKGSRNGR